MLRTVMFLVCLSFLCSVNVIAQDLTHVHPAFDPNTQLIDGSKNPELIPDLTAYRLVLLNVAVEANATESVRKRQKAFLKPVGLSDQDFQTLLPILDGFRADYSVLLSDYNAEVAAADAMRATPNLKAFLTKRDALVESVRQRLQAALSLDGTRRFYAHVTAEKQRMKVDKEIK